MLQKQKQKLNDLYKKVKKDIFYWMIIANIIIWAVSYYNLRNFYNDYVNLLIKTAEAKTKPMQISDKSDNVEVDNSLKVYNRSEVRRYITEKAKEAGLDSKEAKLLVDLSCCESWNNQFFLLHNSDQKKSIDRGIFAINDKWNPNITQELAFNIEFATDWAINNYQKGETWRWYCWERVRSGNYTNKKCLE